MSNQLYDKGREAFLAGDVAWDTDDLKVVLVSASYTFSAAHQFLSSIVADTRVATSSSLTGKTTTGGVADAADITFSSVTGAQITQFVIYKDTSDPATSNLIAYFDTATNLPLTPNGGDITIQWDSGANKIFKL